MLKSRKIQIIAFMAAIFMAVGGIVMIAYATELTKKITGSITYNPERGQLAAVYYVSNNGGDPGTGTPILFNSNGQSTNGGNETFTSINSFVIYKLTLSTQYDSVPYKIKITTVYNSNTYTDVDTGEETSIIRATGLTFGSCTDNDFTHTPFEFGWNQKNVSKETPITQYIRIGLASDANVGSRNITIDVVFDPNT